MFCGEKRKKTKYNTIWYDPKLSRVKKGIRVFFCTNHPVRIYWSVETFEVKDDLNSMRNYVFHDKLPEKNQKL